jgi:hypothetical protein
MHYKNGREAKSGDPVIGKFGYPPKLEIGVIHSLNADYTTCNCSMAVIMPGAVANTCVTVGELYHAEDAFGAMEETQPPERIS